MILVNADNVVIEDVLLFNPYGGIYLNGYAKMTIKRLFGQPLQYGIKINGSEDTNYIDDVHFWPYWNSGSFITGYQKANGTGIALFRCDNPHISNVTTVGYFKGLSLASSSAGVPHKVHLVNGDFDGCIYGVDIDAAAATIQMTNVTIQAPAGATSGNGIWVQSGATGALIQATNLRVTDSYNSAILVDASDVKFAAENLYLENWNQSGGSSDAGFSISDTSSYGYLGIGLWTLGGNGATAYSPTAQFHVA